ncbi:hypothetical protein ACJX0J_029477, partial [Zea mays]
GAGTKETHVTAKCVWPKQSKPTIPIVGMAADGLHTTWVVAENVPEELIDMIPENIDAEGASRKMTGKLTEVIKEAGEKEGFEGDTWELITSDNILVEMADLLNVSLGKNAEESERFIASCSNMVSEVDLNITETEKEIEISDSIDKMVQDLLDSEFDKEKMLVYNKKEDLRREKKYSLRNKKKNNSPKTPELLTLLSGHLAIFNSIIEMHGLIDLDLNNHTFEKLDRFLLEVRRVLIFGKKKDGILMKKSENLSDREKNEKMEEKNIIAGDENTKRLRIHSLLDNGRLVDNEDEINKLATDYYKNLFGPSNITTINMNDMNMRRLNGDDRNYLTNFSRISGILLKRIFGICVMIFVKEIWTSKDLIMVDNAMEMKNFRPICLLNVIFENIFLIVLLLFMKLFMNQLAILMFWRQMDNGCAYLQYADDTIFFASGQS